MIRFRKNLQPILAATILGIGFAAVFLVLWVGTFETLRGLRTQSAQQTVQDPFVPDNVVITKDGEPLISGSRAMWSGGREDYGIAYRDVNGASVPVHVGEQHVPGVMLANYNPPGDFNWPNRLLLYGVPTERETEIWYFVHDGKADGRGRFIGYRWESHDRIGYIGAAGFSESDPNYEDWFPTTPNLWMALEASLIATGGHGAFAVVEGATRRFGDTRPTEVLVRGATAVHLVDLRKRTVEKIYESSAEPPLAISSNYTLDRPSGLPMRKTYLRTPTRILKVGDDSIQQIIPESLRKEDELTYVRLDDDRSVLMTRRPEWSETSLKTYHTVYYVDKEGGITSSREILLRTQPIEPPPPAVMAAYWFLSSPLALDSMAFVFAPFEAIIRWNKTYMGGVAEFTIDLSRNGVSMSIAFFLFAHLFPILGAVYVWRRSGRYGDSRFDRKMWTAFVYLTGVPGLVGYLLHRHWPVSEACVSCGGKTPVSEEHCPDCGRDRGAPELTGLEIFG